MRLEIDRKQWTYRAKECCFIETRPATAWRASGLLSRSIQPRAVRRSRKRPRESCEWNPMRKVGTGSRCASNQPRARRSWPPTESAAAQSGFPSRCRFSFALAGTPWPEEFMTQDISQHGTRFETSHIYVPGDKVLAKIPWGEWSKTGEVAGRVVRVEPMEDSPGPAPVCQPGSGQERDDHVRRRGMDEDREILNHASTFERRLSFE